MSSELPWSEVSIFVGPNKSSIRLVIDGYEMPQELAHGFLTGRVSAQDVERIRALLNFYRENHIYPNAQEGIEQYRNAEAEIIQHGGIPWQRTTPNKKATDALAGDNPNIPPVPFVVLKPEEVGLDMQRLKFYRWLYERNLINEGFEMVQQAEVSQ